MSNKRTKSNTLDSPESSYPSSATVFRQAELPSDMQFSGKVRDRLLPLLLHLYTTRAFPTQEKETSFEIHLLVLLTGWLVLSTSIQGELQSMGAEAKNGQEKWGA